MAKNPRRTKGSRRDKLRARVAAEGRPCHICGRPIDYSLTTYTDPRDGKVKRHPYSYELDEIVPVSLGGDPYDYENVDAAHRICNQRRGNKPLARDERTSGETARTEHRPRAHSRNW